MNFTNFIELMDLRLYVPEICFDLEQDREVTKIEKVDKIRKIA